MPSTARANVVRPAGSRRFPTGWLLLLVLPVVGLLFLLLSYLGVNWFLWLDHSAYGRTAGAGWLGYALLGLGLGAAGGAVAAQRRYRLARWLPAGAGIAAAMLLAGAAATQAPAPAELPAAAEAQPYRSERGRVTCGTCTRVSTSNTRPPQNGIDYEATNLLRRDSTSAWISATGADADNPLLPTPQLRLAIGPLPGHRLVGLRLRNGYCKNAGVYESFGRLQTCLLHLPNDSLQAWTLPDTAHREWFIPLPPPAADSAHLTLTLVSSYPGDNHPEVALAWLVPVFEPLGR